jgi:hypothetical protein
MGETSWKVIENCTDTVLVSGIKGIRVLFSGDSKMCLTAIVLISAIGD